MNGATDVGSIRSGFIVDIADGKRKLAEIRNELVGTGASAKKSSQEMREVANALQQISAKKDQIALLQKSIDVTNARIVQQEKVLKSLKTQLDATFDEDKKTKLEGKIYSTEAAILKMKQSANKAGREIWELDDSIEELAQTTDKTERSVAGLTSVLTALGAGAAAAGIAKTVMTLTDEANQLGNALTGVKQVAGALGHDVAQVTQVTEQLASRGILSLTEAATAVKTALATGYDIEQTINLVNTLTDAAAYNREAHLDWGEAVVTAIQGIKSGNSTLTDAAGITTNLSVMYDKYAKSIGTSAANLTDADKAQAAYNGMIEEAAMFAGNADAALAGYTGTNNAFKKSVEMARVELGEAFLPIVQRITEQIIPLIQRFTDWATANKDVVAGATAAGLALTSLIAVVTTAITVVGALKIAVDALKISLGPAGWLMIGISAVTTGITTYSLAANAATESTWKFAESQDELNRKLNESPLTRSVEDLRKLQEDYERLNTLVERQKELQEQTASIPTFAGARQVTDEMRAITDEKSKLIRELNEVNDALRELGVTSAADSAAALERMRKQIEQSTPALRELRMETLRQIAAQEDGVKQTETLAGRYAELARQESLTKEQTGELTSVVGQLTEKYPELHTELDEQGRLLIVNESLLRGIIAAEQDTVEAALAAEREIKASKVRTAQAAVAAAEAQIKALRAVAVSEKPEWIEGNDLFGDRMRQAAAQAADDKQSEINRQLSEISALQTEINAIDNGTWRELASSTGSSGSKELFTAGTGKDKKAKEKSAKQKTAEEIANDAYRAALKQLEIRRLLGQLTEEQEAETLGKLAAQYKKYDDIWIDAESRRQRVVEQMEDARKKAAEQATKDEEARLRKSYEDSSDWIEEKTREMTEAGRSESEITKMQLDAWTRVRNRYDKDSDYYKRADKAMFDARMNLRKQDEKLAKEIADKQKEYVKDALKAIEAQKKAELAALDERKKATQKYYDDLLRSIDDGERGRERAEIEAEAEKYRYATSERGQKYYAELLEQLRKMDVEDQKQALEDERDAKLDAMDEQKADIESWYDDIKEAADNFNGDMIALYQLTEDERLKAFVTTNQKIIAEMAKFQSEMASLQSSAASVGNSAIIAQMSANAKAWHTADAAGKQRLAAENQALGQSIGASYKNGSWLTGDNVPLFHTGRDGVTGQTFSVGDRLMPDELTAILRRDEYVFTPGQLQSLLDAKASGGTVVHVEKVVGLEIGEATMEDEIDVRALGRTGNDLAADMLRNQFTKGE